jgi:predicted patatin/cPLA2 family phospholipase
MIGLIDCGGGMKGIYTAGIYDYLLDIGISIDYGIGVSAGAANMITFLAGQRGRTRTYYADYTFRKEYMSVSNWLKKGSYLDLDYIYSTLTNRGGENPLDYDAFSVTTCPFFVVATDAQTGDPVYFSRADIAQDSYDVLKASCALPAACRPYPVGGKLFFDGGVADPVPYRRALSDGCEKIVVLLTRSDKEVRKKQKNMWLIARMLRKYPQVTTRVAKRHEVYNSAIGEIRKMETQGRARIVAPEDNCGVGTFTRDRKAFLRLYERGYDDGEKVADFLRG